MFWIKLHEIKLRRANETSPAAEAQAHSVQAANDTRQKADNICLCVSTHKINLCAKFDIDALSDLAHNQCYEG
jgi:hypothetical protein